MDQNVPEENINVMVGTGRDLSMGNNLNPYQDGLKPNPKNHHATDKTGRNLSLQMQNPEYLHIFIHAKEA